MKSAKAEVRARQSGRAAKTEMPSGRRGLQEVLICFNQRRRMKKALFCMKHLGRGKTKHTQN